MENVLPKVLGAIGSFCDGSGVAEVHILQCDINVTRDEWLEPSQLAEYRIAGFGGSDMTAGLDKLVEDAEVNAVLVLTDEYIEYPGIEPPYNVGRGHPDLCGKLPYAPVPSKGVPNATQINQRDGCG